MTVDEDSSSLLPGSALPVLDTRNRVSTSVSTGRRGLVVHTCRVLVVGSLLLMLYRPIRQATDATEPPPIHAVAKLLPMATSIDREADAAGTWSAAASDGSIVGRVARTMPQAANVRGYRGPTEAILALDSESKIASVRVLESLDTSEHVQAVRDDTPFFEQFQGWRLNDPQSATQVDAVSGATLTSLALAGGVLARLGVARGSLVFPEPLTEDEVHAMATRSFSGVGTQTINIDGESASVLDSTILPIGRIDRTGPSSDDIIGYQGPTELLFAITSDGTVVRIEIRNSFDNEPYVDYVRTDRYFWRAFAGKSIDAIGQFDPIAAGVEGVSGATMTSQAVADTIVAAAKKMANDRTLASQPKPSWLTLLVEQVHFSVTELATSGLLIGLGVFLHFKWRGVRGARVGWLLLTIGVLGVWTGNLISLSLLAGWASCGIAWQIAPGLAILVSVSLLWPAVTKSNLYCSHLCPHGAIQQLVRPTRDSRRHMNLGSRLQRALKFFPPTMLALAYLGVLYRPEIDLASWEPFHAYLYPIAGAATIVIAVLSLTISTAVPMAYCRFGCPTGSLLDYVRRSAASGRIGWGDGIAIAMLLLAVAARF